MKIILGAGMLLMVLGGGCLLFSSGQPTVCIDNLDCPLGSVCITEEGICKKSDSMKPLAVVDVELIPKDDSQDAFTQVVGLDLRELDAENLELVMRQPVAVSGKIESPEVFGGIPGTLAATQEPAFDEHAIAYNIPVDEAGRYNAPLAPGVYRLVFKPSDRQYFPQAALSQYAIREDEKPPLSYTAFADPQKPDDLERQNPLLVVCGHLLQTESDRYPASGYQIEAIGENGLRSNLVRPDETGHFCLRLPIEWVVMPDGDLELRTPSSLTISASPASAEARLPSLSWPTFSPTGPHLGTFFVGQPPAVSALSGRVIDSAGAGVAACQIWLEVDVVGRGSFLTQLQSDSKGEFFTTLPHGQLKIKAVPPLGMDAVLTDRVVDFSGDLQLELTLGRRPRLRGQVTDEVGRAVAGVVVRAKRLSSVSGALDGIVRTFETVSDSQGWFEMLVDGGRYMLSLIPPASDGLPWAFPQVVYVVGDTLLESFTTRLPPATLVRGLVRGYDGAPRCGATVRFFYSPSTGPAIILGETVLESVTADCTGRFSLMLPADVPRER